MARTLERFKLNRATARAILRSDGVRQELLERAERVRASAQPSMPESIELTADSYVGSNRAGATVIGVPMRLERKRRILGGAIDAAR